MVRVHFNCAGMDVVHMCSFLFAMNWHEFSIFVILGFARVPKNCAGMDVVHMRSFLFAMNWHEFSIFVILGFARVKIQPQLSK